MRAWPEGWPLSELAKKISGGFGDGNEWERAKVGKAKK